MKYKLITPLYGNIHVELQDKDKETTTEGGLILPDEDHKKLQLGLIKAVGCGNISADGSIVPLTVKVGEYVIFSKFLGTKIDEDNIIIGEDKLLGVVKKD